MKDMNFEFSVDNDGEIEELTKDFEVVNDVDSEMLIKSLVKNTKIYIGERSEGNVTVENDIVKLDYKYCSELGDDWNTDVWDEEKDEFPITELI